MSYIHISLQFFIEMLNDILSKLKHLRKFTLNYMNPIGIEFLQQENIQTPSARSYSMINEKTLIDFISSLPVSLEELNLDLENEMDAKSCIVTDKFVIALGSYFRNNMSLIRLSLHLSYSFFFSSYGHRKLIHSISKLRDLKHLELSILPSKEFKLEAFTDDIVRLGLLRELEILTLMIQFTPKGKNLLRISEMLQGLTKLNRLELQHFGDVQRPQVFYEDHIIGFRSICRTLIKLRGLQHTNIHMEGNIPQYLDEKYEKEVCLLSTSKKFSYLNILVWS